jgi:phosphoribosylaminoimidazole carboxylase PurE protein
MVKNSRPVVLVVMGSEKDHPVMVEAAETLDALGVSNEVQVVSAHRTPERCRRLAAGAAKRGVKVIIAGAGKAAHLAGVIASQTTLPVIGVPLDAGMGGLDALLSTAQMPAGVPVACMAVGRSGAANAAVLAAEILALSDPGLARRLAVRRSRMAAEVGRASRRLARKARA